MPTARHLSVFIARNPTQVYGFLRDPLNLPAWAGGLARSVFQVEGEWFADSPMGRVGLEFATPNDLGVLDHVVTLATGERVTNPMRVLPNAEGAEVVFTLFRRPSVTDEEFEADALAVLADLRALKRLLEAQG